MINIISRCIFLMFFLFCSAACLWAIVFELPLLALAFSALALVWIPIRLLKRKTWIYRLTVFFAASTFIGMTLKTQIEVANDRMMALMKKNRLDPKLQEFSQRDLLGLYGLNLAVGIFAFPAYPEAASKAIRLMIPPPENDERVIHSDFPLESPKLRWVLGKVIQKLNTQNHSQTSSAPVKLYQQMGWPKSDYDFFESEARYAFALTPAMMSIEATKAQDNSWDMYVEMTVPVSYPPLAPYPLLPQPKIPIEQPDFIIDAGLLWVLQQKNWLHPYKEKWVFQFNTANLMIPTREEIGDIPQMQKKKKAEEQQVSKR